jgi:hypothetical protein
MVSSIILGYHKKEMESRGTSEFINFFPKNMKKIPRMLDSLEGVIYSKVRFWKTKHYSPSTSRRI